MKKPAPLDPVRKLVLVLVAAGLLVLAPGGADVVALPKWLVLLAGTSVLLTAWAGVCLRARRLILPDGPLPRLFLALVVLLSVGAMLSDEPILAFLGAYRRWTGVAFWGGIGVVSLTTAVLARREDVERALPILGGVATLSALYGALQLLGVDPVAAGTAGSTATGFFGNPNFHAAALAIAAPLLVVVALAPGRSRAWRAWFAGALVVVVLVLFATQSLQGPLALAGGVVVAGVVLLLQAGRRPQALGLAGVSVLGGVVVVLGVFEVGPLAMIGRQGSVALRRAYWSAATDVIGQNPVFGIGSGRFTGFFRTHRSPAVAANMPPLTEVDSAHNALLDMAMAGGVLAALVLLAIVAVVSLRVLRVAGSSGRDGQIGAALAGAWVAYLVQAAVSPDTVAVGVLGWSVGGMLVAHTGRIALRVGADRHDVVDLERQSRQGTKARKRGAAKGSTPTPAVHPPTRGPAIVGVVASITAVMLLVGDHAAVEAERAVQSGAVEPALESSATAVRYLPFVSVHRLSRLRALVVAQDVEGAEAAAEAMLEVDGRSVGALWVAAQFAAAAGDEDLAAERYRRAVLIDPWEPELQVAAAKAFILVDDLDAARAAVGRALVASPDDPAALALLDELTDS